jgi:hypothetical protein
MTTFWKVVLVAVAVVGLVGLGILLARAGLDVVPVEHRYTLSIIVRPTGDFSLDITPKNASGEPELVLTKGQSGVFNITVVAAGGWDAPVHFQFSGLPDGSYSFSKNPAMPGDTVTLTINTASLNSATAYVCSLIASE